MFYSTSMTFEQTSKPAPPSELFRKVANQITTISWYVSPNEIFLNHGVSVANTVYHHNKHEGTLGHETHMFQKLNSFTKNTKHGIRQTHPRCQTKQTKTNKLSCPGNIQKWSNCPESSRVIDLWLKHQDLRTISMYFLSRCDFYMNIMWLLQLYTSSSFFT